MCDTAIKDAQEKILFWVAEAAPVTTGDLRRLLVGQGVCLFHSGQALRRLRESGCLAADGCPDGKNPADHDGALWRPCAKEASGEGNGTRALGRGYELLGSKLLGSGGHGAVYQGVQKSLNRPVAIKIIPRDRLERSGNPGALVKRLKREAEVLSRFSHPNIVHVIDAGGDAEGESPYVVMELIDAPSLQARVESGGPLSPLEAAEVFRDSARALSYARSKNVLHRDLKPQNILLAPTGAKLVDFGLAQLFADPGQSPPDGESRITREGDVFLGTVMYQPTERHEGWGDQRSDLYALAAVIYFALTGKALFDFEKTPSFTEWAYAHHNVDSRLVDIRHSSRRPDCPERLAQILRRSLRKSPEQRYENYEELLLDLETLLSELRSATPAAGAALPSGAVTKVAAAPTGEEESCGVSSILSDLERSACPAQAAQSSDNESDPAAPELAALRDRMAAAEERFGRAFGDVEVLYGRKGALATRLLELARVKGLMPILRRIFEAHSGLEVDAFEDCVLAYASQRSSIIPPGVPDIPTGLGRYFYDAFEIAENRNRQWFFQEAASEYAEAILAFVEAAPEFADLGSFRKDAGEAGSLAVSELLSPNGGSPPAAAAVQSAVPTNPASSLLGAGVRLGPYTITRHLGGGGMGEVYLARDDRFGRDVAIKILKRSFAGDTEYLVRFEREARIAARLNHPNAVQVYDTLVFEGRPCIVMAYVRGADLSGYLKQRGSLPVREALEIARQLADALAHAHRQDLVHRDVKPDNVLLLAEDGSGSGRHRVMLTDFGLMKSIRAKGSDAPAGGTHTQEGVFLGTPDYVSPEQALAVAEVDSRTDIWALGVVLYEMLSGTRPFAAPSPTALLCKIADEKTVPTPLLKLKPDLDPAVVNLVEKCLRKKPEERWLRAQDVREEIDRILAGSSGKASALGKRRTLTAVAAATLAGLAILAWSKLGPGRQPTNSRSDFELARRAPEASPEVRKTDPADESPSKSVERPRPEPVKEPSAKSDEKPAPKPEPPAPKLREKLANHPPTSVAAAILADLTGLFERRNQDLRFASYDGLLDDLLAFERDRLGFPAAAKGGSDGDYAVSHLKAARRMLDLARESIQTELGKLRKSPGAVVLKVAGGATVAGTVQELDQSRIVLRDEQGATVSIELSKLDLERFVPTSGAPVAELAFRGLTLGPAKTLDEILDFEEADESVLLWVPFLVRLARIEVQREAHEAAAEVKDVLSAGAPVEGSTAALLHHVAFARAEERMSRARQRILTAYPSLDPEFARARREKDSLELLFARRYSQVVASYPGSGAAPVAGQLLLGAFEKDLERGSEELLAGSGWWNNRWEVWPKEPDARKRQKFFDTRDPKVIVLQDPAGSRSLIMNDNATRAPEGILLRVSFEPEAGQAEDAYWSFLLRGGKGRSDSLALRVDAAGIGLYRSVFEAGAKDTCLARAPMPPAGGDGSGHTLALIPAEEYLHVFFDGEAVLNLPAEDARIPNQLDFTVCRGKASVRSMLARKPSPAAAGGGSNKEDK